MSSFPQLENYSIGVGDRFGMQAEAQLNACMLLERDGVKVTPVWNKSHREHLIIGSQPASTRLAADAAVRKLGWKGAYCVDADHVRLETVDRFMAHSDYFTLDVGDAIGAPAPTDAVEQFLARHSELRESISLPGTQKTCHLGATELRRSIQKYLPAVTAAAAIYRRIREARRDANFITEISMDETEEPQTSIDLLVILASAADEGIQLNTLAPKFTGRFNKGVDYVGDVNRFVGEFREDLAALKFAVSHYDLPAALKLSVHSGSDKFSLYGQIRSVMRDFDAGVHLKTAGTTWLEEVTGLAGADDKARALVKELYFSALNRIDELCAPYTSVIAIDRDTLPPRGQVRRWSGEQLVSAIEHDKENPSYNPHLRQLLHVAYKIAAEMGSRYLDALCEHKNAIAQRVTANLYQKHLRPLFLGD
jgi:hypothetical protein